MSSKAPNEDLKDMNVLCTFKIKIKAKLLIIGISKTRDQDQFKIQMPNPSREPPMSSKAPNEDFKDMDDLGTLKIKIEGKNLGHRSTKDQSPYTNQDQDVKPKSGTSSIFQSSKSGLVCFCTFKIKTESQNLEYGCSGNTMCSERSGMIY